MKTKHTPGEWTFERATPNAINIDANGASIAEVYDGAQAEDASGEQAEANARIIAAAPKLLKALHDLRVTVANLIVTAENNPVIGDFLKARLPAGYPMLIEAQAQAQDAITEATS